MTTGLLKQVVFECAVELLHHSEGLTDEQIANKLIDAILEHDKTDSTLTDEQIANKLIGVIHEHDNIKPLALTQEERVVAIQVMNKLIEAIKEGIRHDYQAVL